MKRLSALLLALAMFMLAGFALAEQLPVQRNGALAAYVDGDGHLYLPGNDKAINTATADALISIDAYRVLFLSEKADGTSDLYMIDLGSFAESRIAAGVYTAIMSDEDTLYYVPADNRTQLWRMSLKDMMPQVAYNAAEPIDRLYVSAEGLVFDRVDGMGAIIFDALRGSFQSYSGRLPASGVLSDGYELSLYDGDLTLRDVASLAEEHVDSGVMTYDVMNGVIYYLCNTGSAVRLKGYDPEAMTWQVVLTLDPSMEYQLATTGSQLFMVDNAYQIYAVDTKTGSLTPFKRVSDPASYGLPAGYTATGVRILGMDGQLNVYAQLEEKSSQPDFSFIEFTSTSDTLAPVYRLIETYPIDGEDAAWTFLKPAPQYSPLSRGSRGDAVKAIQQPLYDLGYYDYYIDGIFGPRTQYAVELLQADLNLRVTGIADSDLQRRLINGEIPHFDAFMALTRGNRGMRVQIMQENLRDLGYLADSADGIFGANTQRAVQLFQSENGLPASDGATRETLKKLYSGTAKQCSSYIDLYRGYTGYRVRELNNRLEELYYLEDNPGSTYTAATAEAVRAFQRRVGMPVNGNATVDVLRRLFRKSAPEAAGYITLRRGDENSRVEDLQRRLKELGYYTGSITGYYGASTEKAVKLFQRRVDLSVTGVATVRTQTLLFRSDAPEYVEPTVIGDPVITVDPYEYREKNIYYIADDTSDTGYVTFSWYAEGDVESYRVRIKDASGHTVFDEDTLMSRTGVSLSTLDYDDVYTMTVTAYPEDGNSSHITSSTLKFARIEPTPEPVFPPMGEVEMPEITLETVTRVQAGVIYVEPGQVTLRWHAEGDVDSYFVEITDSDGNTVKSFGTTDEKAILSSDDMAVGEIYTVFVYAIPTNGELEDAAINAELFSLEDASIPVIEEEEEEEEEPLTAPGEIETEEPVDEEPVDEEPVDEEPVVEEPVEEQPVEEQPVEEEPVEEEPEIVETVEEQPEETVEEQPEVEETVTETPVDAAETVTVPQLSFDPLIGEADGVSYVGQGVLTMGWISEGDVIGYEVTVYNGSGDAIANATTDKNGLSVDAANLAPGEVYRLEVSPISASGEIITDATAQALFALYVETAPAEPEAVEEAPEVVESYPEQTGEDYAQESYPEETYVEESQPEETYEVQSEEAVYVQGDNEPVSQDDDYAEYEDGGYQEYQEAQPEYDDGYEESYDEGGYEESYDEGGYEESYDEGGYEESYEEGAEESYEEESYEEAPADAGSAYDDTVAQAQNRLVSWGWLEADSFQSGVLDGATIQAVRTFQSWFNDNYGGSLPQAEGEIDEDTLALLLNQNGDVYAR